MSAGLDSSTELADAILNVPVRIRDALVLSEMFKRGCNHECFEQAPALSSILEDSRQQLFEVAQSRRGAVRPRNAILRAGNAQRCVRDLQRRDNAVPRAGGQARRKRNDHRS